MADVWLLMSGCYIEQYRGFRKNSVYTRPDPIACWTAMRVVRIVHQTYEVLRDLTVCVYSLWSLYGVVCQGAV